MSRRHRRHCRTPSCSPSSSFSPTSSSASLSPSRGSRSRHRHQRHRRRARSPPASPRRRSPSPLRERGLSRARSVPRERRDPRREDSVDRYHHRRRRSRRHGHRADDHDHDHDHDHDFRRDRVDGFRRDHSTDRRRDRSAGHRRDRGDGLRSSDADDRRPDHGADRCGERCGAARWRGRDSENSGASYDDGRSSRRERRRTLSRSRSPLPRVGVRREGEEETRRRRRGGDAPENDAYAARNGGGLGGAVQDGKDVGHALRSTEPVVSGERESESRVAGGGVGARTNHAGVGGHVRDGGAYTSGAEDVVARRAWMEEEERLAASGAAGSVWAQRQRMREARGRCMIWGQSPSPPRKLEDRFEVGADDRKKKERKRKRKEERRAKREGKRARRAVEGAREARVPPGGAEPKLEQAEDAEGLRGNGEVGRVKQRAEATQSESEEEEIIGPALPTEGKASGVKSVDYGKALRPGEGSKMAAFVQDGERIPRRGEIGLTSDEISSYEKHGYVMSGSRNRRMEAVRIRKENQIYSAEELAALSQFSYEERKLRETRVLNQLRVLVESKLGDGGAGEARGFATAGEKASGARPPLQPGQADEK